MLQHMELCRWLYNQLLKAKRENPNLGRYDTQRLIVKLKKENPKLNNVYSKVLQMVNHQLWSNLKGLNELKGKGHKVGKLRYKTSPNSWKTLNYNQSGFKLDEERKRLHLSKIGEIPIKLHRRIKGKVKGVITGQVFLMKQEAPARKDGVVHHLPYLHKLLNFPSIIIPGYFLRNLYQPSIFDPFFRTKSTSPLSSRQ